MNDYIKLACTYSITLFLILFSLNGYAAFEPCLTTECAAFQSVSEAERTARENEGFREAEEATLKAIEAFENLRLALMKLKDAERKKTKAWRYLFHQTLREKNRKTTEADQKFKEAFQSVSEANQKAEEATLKAIEAWQKIYRLRE